MKKTIINLIAVLVIVAGTFGATREWFPRTVDNTVVDTVKVDVPYEVTKIKEVEKPVRVTQYKTKYDTIETVRVEKDTVFINTDIAYNARFLTNYPTAPKFLGSKSKNNQVSLTFVKPTGQTRTKTWDVGDRGWKIGLNNGQPNIETFVENKTEFNYSVEGGYIRFFSYGSAYLELSTEFRIFNFNATATINANQNPFGKVGVKYEF